MDEVDRYRYQFMRLSKIQQVLTECPIAIQPTGLLEWHGDHNAIGLDGLTATHICERVITKIGNGVLMPTNWIGTYGYIHYPGTVCYDQPTTKEVFHQIFHELMKLGFKVIIILTGHWGALQMKALNGGRILAEKDAKKEGLNTKLFSLRWADFLLGISAGGHGKEGETSLLWRIGQQKGIDLVDVSKYSIRKEDVPKYNIKNRKVPKREPEIWDWETNLSDPKICNPERGEQIISKVVEGMTEELIEALNSLGFKYSIS